MLFRQFNLIRWLSVMGFSCLFSIAASASASAITPSQCDFIHLDIVLETDGDLLVTETQKCLLEPWIIRKLESIDPQDKLLTYKLLKWCYVSKVIHPLHRQRRELYRSLPQNQLGSRTVTHIPKIVEHDHTLQPTDKDTTEASSSSSSKAQTIVLKYRIVDGVETHDRYSQIYWQNLWSDSCFPINIGKITLQLPASLANQVRYFEANASNIDVTSRQIAPDKFEFALEGPLRPTDGWNVRIVFPSDQFNQPVSQGKQESQPDNTVLETAHWPRGDQLASILYSFNAFKIIGELIFLLGLLLVFAAPLYPFVIIIRTIIKYRCPYCHTFNSMYPIDEPRRLTNHPPPTHRTSGQKPYRCKHCSYVQRSLIRH